MESDTSRLLDRQFSRFLASHSSLQAKEKERLQAIICRLSEGYAKGDSCLPLNESEAALLQDSGLVGEGAQPLYLFAGRLYLQRFFQYEKQLAKNIVRMAREGYVLEVDRDCMETLFAGQAEDDLQRVAAEKALQKNLLIISGGPGTGKTTTVAKILSLLQHVSSSPPRIALAAPTGKAAMRLQESIHAFSAEWGIKALTLHRLLGVQQFSPFFRHNAKNPLSCDVLVVDEASMVDLSLMSKLLDALRPGSRLILLGDKNQLASVESGTVLADMMAALPENSVELQKSYRFDQDIKRFSEAINSGNQTLAWQILCDPRPEHIALLEETLVDYGGRKYAKYMQSATSATSMEEYSKLFAMLYSFKILCAVNHGEFGVQGVNAQIEIYFAAKGYGCLSTRWYVGRPVMVTKNEYGLDLYNGDIGICLPDPEEQEKIKVWFEKEDGTLRGILPGRIKHCETLFALTIHKSQGTEVDDVLVVLPEQESNLITRELLYTAVTRARKSITIRASKQRFQQAVREKIKRASGLVRLIEEYQKAAKQEAAGKNY